MRDLRHCEAGRLLLLSLVLLVLCTSPASAYVGPGAGLEFLGYSLGLLMWTVGAFSAVALWPVYAFIRWWRGSQPEPPPTEDHPVAGQDPDPDRA